MKVLVTGITGYVGAALAPRLQAAGHVVRGFARAPERVQVPVAEVVQGDVVTGAGVREALAGIDVAYYLVHSMEAGTNGVSGSFVELERHAAAGFAQAARAAGVQRIVYLGGPVPQNVPLSRHLASRLEVEALLMAAVPTSIAFRASIVIGARSRSFRFLVRLIERLPVIPLPAWRRHRTRPIDGRDVLTFLVRAADAPVEHGGRSWDLAGPDLLTYEEMIAGIADHMLVRRPRIGVGITLTRVAAVVAAAVASEDRALITPLMESLSYDLLPRDRGAAAAFDVRLHSFDAAVERALREWETEESLRAR